MNDRAGNKVRTALVWDTHSKLMSKIELMGAFADQLHLRCKVNSTQIRFPGGSLIEALTAGGRRAGASQSYQRFHLSELPHWQNAQKSMNSLRPALSLNGRIIVETTMAVGQDLPISLWKKDNGFKKIFFSVEEHNEYIHDPKNDPKKLRPDTINWLREEGFTVPEVMVFLQDQLDSVGDPIEVLREFPRTDIHCFAFSSGRWIRVTPEILNHETKGQLRLYRQPAQCSPDLLIGVDTSGAVGRDNSAIAVIDKKDGALVACWTDNETTSDRMTDIVKMAWEFYRRPPVLVEIDGIGRSAYQDCVRKGVPAIEVHTSKSSRYSGLLAVRNGVESGVLKGPAQLAHEAEHLFTERGVFTGPKDLCMAIGFCLNYMQTSPYQVKAHQRDPNVFDLKTKLKRLKPKSWINSTRF